MKIVGCDLHARQPSITGSMQWFRWRPGPCVGAASRFSWANSARLYYSNLTANLSASKRSETFKGTEAIAVSRTDDVQAAAAGDASAWTDPVKQGLNRVWS